MSLQVAEELPEPNEPVISYEFEIAWGTKTSLTWQAITPKSVNIIPGESATTHVYYGMIGDNTFESVSWNTTVTTPMKIVAVFDIANIPNDKWYDIFRIRSRCIVNLSESTLKPIVGAWSQPSYWRLIIDLQKLGLLVGTLL